VGEVAVVASLCWFAVEQLRHVSPRLFKSGLARRAEKVRRRGVAERIF
jgi:sigma54-dependent transcription regulator